jgi:hypothetical protein
MRNLNWIPRYTRIKTRNSKIIAHKIYVENLSQEKPWVATGNENFTIIVRVNRRISNRYKMKRKEE